MDFFFVFDLFLVEPPNPAGIAGIPPAFIPAGIPGGIPEVLTCFINFCAAAKRSTRLFTSETLRPLPRAIRARRDPLSSFGFDRYIGVIDSTIAL